MTDKHNSEEPSADGKGPDQGTTVLGWGDGLVASRSISESFTTAPSLPDRVGPYRILEELGHGGMGVVYLAEQTEPVRRRIALKMLQTGLGSRKLQVRFEAERQAMARLHHPNVAQLYEASDTEDGQPYFAMELVEGLPVTDYCDRKRLNIRERLEIFQDICRGVQHAHEKGLIHRDLKPTNILVTEENDEPTPKVLDFGIAKAIDQPLVEGTLFTGEQVIGTPAYLSPEAVETVGIGFDLDTRSDVYSLGILLYELLVGVRPFETKGVALVKVLKQITEKEHTGPSTRWTALARDTRAGLAETRRHDAASLSKRLKGDLDWIVLKAIAKDRRERYSSAADLAADIGRHLNDQPVEASPPSTLYRVGKFVRRRRGTVLAAALVLVSLLTGLFGTIVGLTRAQQEAERANQEASVSGEIADFLTDLFEVTDPGEARGNSITARELLDRGSEKIDEGFAEQPLVRARFMLIIGEVFKKLGLYDQAQPLLEGALEIREEQLEDEHLDIATALDSVGNVYRRQARYHEAELLFQRSLAIKEKALEPDHPDVAKSLNSLAILYRAQGHYDQAKPLYLRSLAIHEKVLGPDHPRVATSLNNLANLYRVQGHYDQAEPLYLRSLVIREKALGSDHPYVAHSLNNLAVLYRTQGHYDQAEPLYLRSLVIREKVLGPDHPDVAMSLNNLASLYKVQGHDDQAEPLYLRSLVIREKALGPDHPDVAESLNHLAILYRAQGHYDQAEPLYLRSLAIREKALGSDHPSVAKSLNNLAVLYKAQGYYDQAEPLYRRSLAIQEKALGPDHLDVAMSLNNLAVLASDQGHDEKAEALHLRSLSIRERALGLDHPKLGFPLGNLGQIYWKQGKYEKAEEFLRRALELREGAYDSDHVLMAEPLWGLGGVYRDQGRYEDAEPLYQRALMIQEKALSPDHKGLRDTLTDYAQLLRATGREAEARELEARAQLPNPVVR